MPKRTAFTKLIRFLRGSKTNLAVAAIIAIGLSAAVSIFAAGPQYVHDNCPEPVVKWAYKLGWKNPDTFTCRPDYAKHEFNPQPGSVAEKEFAKIRSEQDLAAFLKSDNELAKKIRSKAKEHLGQKSYEAWVTGQYFQAVQFKKPAVMVGAAIRNEQGDIEADNETPRNIKANDIIFVFVDPTKKEASTLGETVQAAADYAPVKVTVNPALDVEIKVSGDCKGANARRTKDGVATFSCRAGEAHTVTAQKQARQGGTAYTVAKDSQRVQVKKQGGAEVSFTYQAAGPDAPQPPAPEGRGSVTIKVKPALAVEAKISGDCQGVNSGVTENGTLTFTNCAPGKHTITLPKTAKDGDLSYKLKQATQNVTIKKGGNATAKFEYQRSADSSLTGVVNGAGNIRLDCGNQHATRIIPQDKQEAGALKIVKFEDKNGNKKQDKDEPPMPGVRFKVKGIGVFVTDNKGQIEIANLVPHTYTVQEIMNGQSPYSSTTGLTQKAKVVNKKTATAKFGNKLGRPVGSIKVVKFEDKNGNSRRDAGENLLKGVAYEVAGYGTYQTNDNGVINITNVPLGQQVEVKELESSLVGGATATAATEPPTPAPEAATDTTTGKKNEPKNGVNAETQKFGGVETVTVNDIVYASSASFSKQVQKYAAKPKWVCFYLNPEKGKGRGDTMCGEKKAFFSIGSSVRDDSSGTGEVCYRTSDKKEGTATICSTKEAFYSGGRGYTILIVPPERYAKLKQQAGASAQSDGSGSAQPAQPGRGVSSGDAISPDVLAAIKTTPSIGDAEVAAPLQPGVTYKPTTPVVQTATAAIEPTPVVFGNRAVPLSAQSGALLIGKAIDTNANGRADDADQPQAAVEFAVTGPNGFSQTVTTNEFGFAALGGLAEGGYAVTEKVPAGYFPVGPTTQQVTVASNQIAPAAFLNRTSGGLVIGKAVDTNADGKADDGDQPQAGVGFTVTGPNGYSSAVTTNANGLAAIGGLAPGEYTVTEKVPDGYAVTVANPQKVTVTQNQVAAAAFLNKDTCDEAKGETCKPSGGAPKNPILNAAPVQAIAQTVGALPKTGLAGLVVVLTFLAASGVYYGSRYLRARRASR